MPLPAHFGDAILPAEQRLRRRGTQRADRLRPDGQQLPIKKLPADLHLIQFRSPVFRRTALHDVADKALAPIVVVWEFK